MSIALVDHKTCIGTNTATTAVANMLGATLLTVTVGWYNAFTAFPTITDSQLNIWVRRSQAATTGSPSISSAIWDCISPSVSATQTFTFTGVNVFASMSAQGWSGTDPSPFDVQNSGSNSSGTTINTGTVTPANSGSLVLASLVPPDGSTGTFTVDSSLSFIDRIAYSNGVNEGMGCAYLIQSVAAAINPQFGGFTTGNNSGAGACIAVYKSSGAPPAAMVRQLAALGAG